VKPLKLDAFQKLHVIKHQNVFAINFTSNLCISHIIYMTAMLQGSTAEEIFLSHVSAFDKVSKKFKNLQQICNN
jgi:hypothetical protein